MIGMQQTNQNRESKWRIGEILIQRGSILWEQLELALNIQKESNCPLGEILIEMKAITSGDFYRALALQHGRAYVDLNHVEVQAEAVRVVPHWFVREYEVLPLVKSGNVLLVAISDPNNAWPLSKLEEIANLEDIRFVLAPPSDIRRTIERFYGPESMSA